MEILILLKRIGLLFLLISASSLFTSFAGRHSKFENLSANEVGAGVTAEQLSKKQATHREEIIIHERLLRVNTKDYGTYDPAPALVKPPFKLIPN